MFSRFSYNTISAAMALMVGILVVCTIGYMQHGSLFRLKDEVSGYSRIRLLNLSDFNTFFYEHQFFVEDWRSGKSKVPRLLFSEIPEEWREEIVGRLTIPQKKDIFLQLAVPLVLIANDEIMKARSKLLTLAKKAGWTEEEKNWILKRGRDYKVKTSIGLRKVMNILLRRMDVIPPSIAIAQMIEESGWGASRFAAEGNALYGQWSYQGGLKPLQQRSEKGDHRIQVFETPLASVRAYMRNLNTNAAYRGFRNSRAELRNQEREVAGSALIHTLTSYSERGEAYIQTLRSIIAGNRLLPFDASSLGAGQAFYLIFGRTL